ncbi:acyltransferase [Chryseobacterium sediminis]|uniref:acyltransferase family protein n=1 Tax=Chryseobacterium sediminis TaxID=1679494 RepID=UPI00285DEC10|nr:acyltransferase [Chryseobacterium sediminis]MDR6463013.1 peptidoglycan/LPS O-acetylase OafA/YrhL [Chryseobacterium sediminis]
MNSPNKINNFDLIRLLAALQVVFTHSVHHLEIKGMIGEFGDMFVYYFPGVPIFFTISGFLIYWSFDRNSDNITKYFKNRLLRLYPALWFCLLITIVLLLYDAQHPFLILKAKEFWLWIIGQLTIFQFWTPDILRFWGVSAPNGSLWTIVIEIQFYIFVPVLYFLLKTFKEKKFLVILTFIIISLAFNIYFAQFPDGTMINKLAGITVFPYLYNFLFGVLSYIYWDKIKGVVENKGLLWISFYIAYIVIFGNWLGNDLNSYFLRSPYHLISNIILVFVVLSASFTYNSISGKLLKHNDISYGIYIYHMLIINLLVQRKMFADTQYLILAFISTIILASVSWFFVEKKFLKFKNSNKK